MGRLSNLRVADPILTTIARGYANNDLISELLFPMVEVDKEGGKIPTWGKEAFQIWQTERAIKADSNEMELPWLSTTSYELTEHDLTGRIDYRELEEANLIDLETNAVNTVMQAIQLRREKIAADLAQNADNYATANKITYTDNYLNEDAVDPIAAIDTGKEAVRALIGKYPNTMIWGANVWRKLKSHKKIKSYFSNNERQLITEESIKQLCEIDNFIVGRSIYTADNSTFTDIWGNNIILAYVAPNQGVAKTPYQPAFGYTLRKAGHPFSSKWDSDNGKLHFVNTTDNFDVKLVGAESGYLIKNPIDPGEL